MKLFSLLCAALVTVATLTPVTAEASPRHGGGSRVTYDHCGRPIFWTYTCVGHDHCGRPIMRWVQSSRGGYGGGYSGHGGGYGRGDYGRGDRSDYGHGHSRGGISFHYSR